MLFRLSLILRRKAEDIMIFSPAPWFRILFLLLFIIILTGMVSVFGDASGTKLLFIPGIIGTICFFAAFYEESWCFDRKEKILVYKYGLIFFFRKKSYSFDEIESFRFVSFLRGAVTDRSADKEINLLRPFSRESTDEIAGAKRVIHNKKHQELSILLTSGDSQTVEMIDGRNTEPLKKKAGILAEFCGIPLLIEE